jgi:hypothetical protein
MQRTTLGFMGGVAIAVGAYLPIRTGSGLVGMEALDREGLSVLVSSAAGLPVLVAGVILASVSLGARLGLLDEARAALVGGASAVVAMAAVLFLANTPLDFPTAANNVVVDHVDEPGLGLAVVLVGVALGFLHVVLVARSVRRTPLLVAAA